MAYVSSVRSFPTLADHVSAFLTNLRDQRARRAVYEKTLRELGSMTDRELADIGISALQIEDIARKHAYGR